MVEGHDEVIYEEINTQNYQHERSRSAPDITPYKPKIRNYVCTSGTSSLRRRKQKQTLDAIDGQEKVIQSTTLNNSKAFEIYEDQGRRKSNLSIDREEVSYLHFDQTNGTDSSIYVKMNERIDEDVDCEDSPLLEHSVSPLASPLFSDDKASRNNSIYNDVSEKSFSKRPPDIPIRTDLIDGAKTNGISYPRSDNCTTTDAQLYDNFSNTFLNEKQDVSYSMLEQLVSSQPFDYNQIYDNISSPTQAISQHPKASDTEDFNGIYADIPLTHQRDSSDSSNGSFIIGSPVKTRSAEELGSRRCRQDPNRNTIYAEILHNSQCTEITNSRITRQSDNPILRNGLLEKLPAVQRASASVQRAASLNQLDRTDIIYGEVEHVVPRRKKVYQTGSKPNRPNRPQSMYLTRTTSNGNPQPLRHSINELYENSVPLRRPIHTPVPLPETSGGEIIDFQQWQDQKNTFEEENSSVEHSRNNSYYENVEVDQQYYENASDADSDDIIKRERSRSKPIEIYATTQQRKGSQPFSYSSSSIASSPRGSTCSNTSSDFSTFASNSVSPPPLPTPRKRGDRYASWGNIYTFTGLNYFPAHFLGKEIACKVTSTFIDTSINTIAQNTNVLEMKPVLAEISHDFIRFACNSSPWEVIASFPIEEVLSYQVIKKNAFFLGIIAGKAGEDAICYVLQSDKAPEISDAIQDVFRSVSKIPRSQTLEFQQPSIEPEFHRYHSLVRIGCIKVKKSFHNVNDYIKIILDKVNPKEFRNINMEIIGQNIVIGEENIETEMSHSTPSILTLAIFLEDKRYFGYIISELTPGGKSRVQCHVYRAVRYETAAKIITSISQSCQYSYTPQKSSNCDINPIYAQTKTAFSNVQPRGSTSSASSYATSPSSITSSLPSSPTSDIQSIKFPSRQNSAVDNLFAHSSTETLLTLTPSPSIDQLPRSSAVTTSIYRRLDSIGRRVSDTCPPINRGPPLLRSVSHNVISSYGDMNKEIKSHDENPIYQRRDEIRPQFDTYATIKDATAKQSKHKRLFKKIRHSIKHNNKHHDITPIKTPPIQHPTNNISLDEEFTTVQLEDLKPETFNFPASYVCSTVVSPPLKRKHVKECYKQYTKEMTRVGKLTNNNNTSIKGSPIDLEITTNSGITMLDPTRQEIIRQFAIETIELFIQHPDGEDCFGISTSVPGNSKQHKCHLFCIKHGVLISDINNAFDKLMSVKKLLNL